MKNCRLSFFALLTCVCTVLTVAQDQFAILVFAQPEKWHKDCVPVARESISAVARHHQFALTWTEDAAAFDDPQLSRFAAIVFVNCTGEALGAAQRERFAAYIRGGGNFVAVHAAASTTRGWDWYDQLIGRVFRTHPYVQTGVAVVTDPGFPACAHLPGRWVWTDEWYEFDAPLTANLRTVLRVDETTYDPTRTWPGGKAEGMGADHPVAWYHEFEGARVFVTALGHMPELYRDQRYLDHIYGGIYWAATGRGAAATGPMPSQ
ncbi:MAG TPA: ThuA domain-containing protein [Opitutaceae bacterium]|nr:ThuA domain-containing protein [Opitutaceae bacterium]